MNMDMIDSRTSFIECIIDGLCFNMNTIDLRTSFIGSIAGGICFNIIYNNFIRDRYKFLNIPILFGVGGLIVTHFVTSPNRFMNYYIGFGSVVFTNWLCNNVQYRNYY